MKKNTIQQNWFMGGAMLLVSLATSLPIQAQPEVCNAGVNCAGTGLALLCTISLSPFDGMASQGHFIGQQFSGENNNNAICIQGGVTNTFTGSATQVGNGTNTNMFPLLLQARRNPTANATNPKCVFRWKTSGYAVTSVCTMDMADGLPVELMEFSVDE